MVTECVSMFLVNQCIVDVLFLPLNTTIIHPFIVIVLGTIELDLHKTNVLVSISFGWLDLFNYRRGKYQCFKEKYEKRRLSSYCID